MRLPSSYAYSKAECSQPATFEIVQLLFPHVPVAGGIDLVLDEPQVHPRQKGELYCFFDQRDCLFRSAQMHERNAELAKRNCVISIKCDSCLPLAQRLLHSILQSAKEPHHRACPRVVRILLNGFEEQLLRARQVLSSDRAPGVGHIGKQNGRDTNLRVDQSWIFLQGLFISPLSLLESRDGIGAIEQRAPI